MKKFILGAAMIAMMFLIIIVLVVRPTGLFGEKLNEKV